MSRLPTKVRGNGSGGGQHQMASKDTGGQKRASKTSEEVEETQVDESTDVAERKEQLDSDIDSMLDEIDDVLESNSEDFVRSFVQKGGE